MDKNNASEKAYELGAEYESRATDCCQSAIAAIQDALGCRNNDIFRAGSPLAGGVGFSSKGTCGALIGATMVIGQLYGRTRAEFDIDAKREIDDPDFDFVAATGGARLAYEIYERFIDKYGSCICYDVSDKVVGRIQEKSSNGNGSSDTPKISRSGSKASFHSKEGCGSVVGNAAKWATEIILREGIPKNI